MGGTAAMIASHRRRHWGGGARARGFPARAVGAIRCLLFLCACAFAFRAQAQITDNFLERDREMAFRTNLIYGHANHGDPISDEIVGGALQFGEPLELARTTVTEYSRNPDTGETLYSVAIPGDNIRFHKTWPDCPAWIRCAFLFKTRDGEPPRTAFVRGETFLIEAVEVKTKADGEFSHFLTLSEARATPKGIRAIPGRERKCAIKCVAPIRLKQWSLIVGLNNYIYPFITKENKEKIAGAALSEVPRIGGGGEKKQEEKPAGKGEADRGK